MRVKEETYAEQYYKHCALNLILSSITLLLICINMEEFTYVINLCTSRNLISMFFYFIFLMLGIKKITWEYHSQVFNIVLKNRFFCLNHRSPEP